MPTLDLHCYYVSVSKSIEDLSRQQIDLVDSFVMYLYNLPVLVTFFDLDLNDVPDLLFMHSMLGGLS